MDICMAKSILINFFFVDYVFHNFNKRLIIRTLITKKVVMKKLNLLKLFLLSFLIGGLFSCELRNDDPVPILKSDQGLEGMIIVNAGDNGIEIPAELCGEPLIVPVKKVGMGDPSIGQVIVANDEEYLYVKIEITAECWKIKQLYIYAGAFKGIPMPDEGNYPAFWGFPLQRTFDEALVSFTYRFPLDKLPECPAILVKALVVCGDNQGPAWAMGTNPGWDLAAYYLEYCVEDCNGCKPGIYRTQTPGGWGAKPAGNNPGAYLLANFDAAIGELVVGGPLTITLTSAKAIEILLPTGGKPAALTEPKVVDPLKIKNVLVGHVVALSLSVWFDLYDPDFSDAEGDLEDLIIDNGGAFDGWSVAAILAEANSVLGGGSSSYTPSEMTDILSMINEYFVDGKLSGDYKLFKCVKAE